LKRNELEREGKKWVHDDLITEDQYDRIMERYPKKEQYSLLLIFAGIFIGLGFLTFVASNWSAIPNLGKMTIIIGSMLAFYVSGERFYQKGKRHVATSFYVISLLIFGAGIFLTGQMYHYTFFSAFPFVVWATAALVICMSRPETVLYILSLVIITVGQYYEATNYESFNFGLLFLVIIWFVEFLFQKKVFTHWLALLFGISFSIHAFILAMVELYYVMFIPLLLLLYMLNVINVQDKLGSSLRKVAVFLMFGLNGVHIFLFSFDFIADELEMDVLFHVSIIVTFIGALLLMWFKDNHHHMIDLILFIPVVYFGSFADFASLFLLFGFSIGSLLLGYQRNDPSRVNIGTIAFLVSTVLAYIQLAWDFLDKSLFFFIGGIFLFLLSYFLEKRRRSVVRSQGGESS
jgi:uncharacterized membrane protein